jgi:adenosylcobyric acid synthase
MHMGETSGPDCTQPLLRLSHDPDKSVSDGAISPDGRVMGCYLHGLFTSDVFRRFVLGSIGVEAGSQTHTLMIDQALDELAIALEIHLDVDGLLALAG